MGLLSHRIDKESLIPGDHIYSWRAAYIYAHHVIHFTQRGQEVGTGTVVDVLLVSSVPSISHIPCPTCTMPEGGNGVVLSCLNCFLAGGFLYRFEYNVNPVIFLAKVRGGTCTQKSSDSNYMTVHRAKYLLENGFGCYHVADNNCEDFAIYCKTSLLAVGEGRMRQSGQAASILGFPLAAVQSAPSYLFTSNIYWMAATAVGTYFMNRLAADIGQRKDVVKVSLEDLTRILAIRSLWVAKEKNVVGAPI